MSSKYFPVCNFTSSRHCIIVITNVIAMGISWPFLALQVPCCSFFSGFLYIPQILSLANAFLNVISHHVNVHWILNVQYVTVLVKPRAISTLA